MSHRATCKLPPAALLACALAACANPGVRLRPAPVVGAAATAPAAPGHLDRACRAVLAREGLLADFRAAPAGAAGQLHRRWAKDLNAARREELAAVCAAGAARVERRDPQAAAGLRLAAAEVAWPVALAGAGPCRALYNDSCARVAGQLMAAFRTGTRTCNVPGPWRNYRLQLAPADRRAVVDPTTFDELVRSDCLQLRGLGKLERHRVEGVGADFVGHYQRTPERAAKNPLLALNGTALPLNAALDFGSSPARPRLAFRDLTLATTATLGGRTAPLTADHTAPIAKLMDDAELAKPVFNLKAMFRSTEYDKLTGIYQTEPWREGQIPVVLVHGLMSSPLTWLTVWNELRSDPQLQARYQFLAFRYPTGYPIGRNATTFRDRLRALRRQVDPAGRNPDLRRMVLVGHSMGGILSDLQVRHSGEEARELFFERSLDQVSLTNEERQGAAHMMYFEPNPDVRRVVFMAVPHRGSNLATNWIGRLGSRLIRMPLSVITLGLSNRQSIGGTTSYGRQILAQGNDSIRTLKPDNPLLAATLRMPLGRDVVCHSIVGKAQPLRPLAESGDGVVPYWSAHLDGAASEKVVRATHTGIVQDPEAIEELRRILYLHAGIKPAK